LVAESKLGGRVEFVGRLDRPEVYANMKGALFTVLASPAEGHPIAVLESMAAGVPVVAARAPGTSETVQDGVTGALFPAGDLDAFGTLMRHYATSEAGRSALGSNLTAWDRASVDIRELARTDLRILTGT
jgi:glycosyltransferase involved in cell wall biosynthesis